MFADFLLQVFELNRQNDAFIWNDCVFDYAYLLNRFDFWNKFIQSNHILSGDVVAIEADFCPDAVALMLALIENTNIIVPIAQAAAVNKSEMYNISQCQFAIDLGNNNDIKTLSMQSTIENDLYKILRNSHHPGLVLFSSGSTGKIKAALHDFTRLLIKYKTKRQNLRTLTFLLFDHIGGIDTLFYSLSNGSCVITVNDRSPDKICAAIEKYNVEVLPVTPTFLNLLIISEAYSRYDLSSLKYITYGTEVMPENTLKKCHEIFLNVNILQKFGTTETGTLRSKSKSSDSLWVRIGGEGYQTRVVNGILQIKTESAMLGYLNAPSPFSEDGWFDTGDSVEVDGEYIKILGRRSEIINVGGEKVYPAEIENVIQEMENISEVTVYGEKNPILGNIVCARLSLIDKEDKTQLIKRLKEFCRNKLENFKIPIKIEISHDPQHGDRYKKVRSPHTKGDEKG